MGEDTREDGSPVAEEQRSPEQIEADIERTRREMGDTVAAVAEKSDVKAQAKSKVEETRARITEKKDEVLHRTRAAPDSAGDGAEKVASAARENQRALAIGGAVLVAFLLGRRSAR